MGRVGALLESGKQRFAIEFFQGEVGDKDDQPLTVALIPVNDRAEMMRMVFLR